MQTAQEQLQKKNQELFEMYREKSKKFTQITNLYNLLKSRAMKSQMQTAASDSVSQALNSLASRNEPSTSGSNRPMSVSQVPQTPLSHNYPVNQEGVEQLHRYQRSGTGSSRGKRKSDRTVMPPPNRPIGTARPSRLSYCLFVCPLLIIQPTYPCQTQRPSIEHVFRVLYGHLRHYPACPKTVSCLSVSMAGLLPIKVLVVISLQIPTMTPSTKGTSAIRALLRAWLINRQAIVACGILCLMSRE